MPAAAYFESDLYLLKQLFFPQASVVALLDPEGAVKPNMETPFFRIADQSSMKALGEVQQGLVIINMTNIPVQRYPVQPKALEGVLSFAKKGETYKGFTTDRFYYVQNEIETIRWVFSNNLRYPHFLRYYDSLAAYSNLFKGFCRLSGAFRELKWLADGHFEVLHPSGLFFDNLPSGPYQGFTLFTKDAFQRGIALLQLIHDDRVVSYAKLPLTANGLAYLQHEHQVLSHLSAYTFRTLRQPAATWEDNLLLLSNVMALPPTAFTKWRKYHFRALGEYTRAFARDLTLEQFLKQEAVLDKMGAVKQAIEADALPQGLGPTNALNLYKELVKTLNSLPLEASLTVSLVHGDFTEENLSIEKETLIMVDWEQAHFSWPALSDLLLFIGYRMEEEGPPDLERFQDEWQKLTEQEAFRVLCSEFARQPMLHFRVFWFIKALTYLWNALSQTFLPYYVNWRLYLWRQLLEAYQQEAEWLTVPAPKARVTESNLK
jgi:thiamine kinase-like enzyme